MTSPLRGLKPAEIAEVNTFSPWAWAPLVCPFGANIGTRITLTPGVQPKMWDTLS